MLEVMKVLLYVYPCMLQPVVGGGISLGGNASLSPRVASPNPDASSMLNPHILQQQSRLSPHSKFINVQKLLMWKFLAFRCKCMLINSQNKVNNVKWLVTLKCAVFSSHLGFYKFQQEKLFMGDICNLCM